MSGVNFERFVIIVTSLHRDYLPSSWKPSDEITNNWKLFSEINYLWYTIPLTILAGFAIRVVIYSFLVILTQLVSKKISKSKL